MLLLLLVDVVVTSYQAFKTERRGWGIRCLDDIPKGGFICVYAGHLLTDQEANEDGKQIGDEYLAELDLIEVVEKSKDGYESDVDVTDSDQASNSGSLRVFFTFSFPRSSLCHTINKVILVDQLVYIDRSIVTSNGRLYPYFNENRNRFC